MAPNNDAVIVPICNWNDTLQIHLFYFNLQLYIKFKDVKLASNNVKSILKIWSQIRFALESTSVSRLPASEYVQLYADGNEELWRADLTV